MPALNHDTGRGAPHVPVSSGGATPIAADARRAFGARLRTHRERRGISLSAIAATTKVKSSLLDGLERGDLSRWPVGIYRRAFFRDYAAAIGLPVEIMTAEFAALFLNDPVENPAQPKPGDAASRAWSPVLRLTLDGSARLFSLARARVAVIDTAVILLASLAVAFVARADVWQVAAAIALFYYAVATACFGRSPVSWWLLRPPARAIVPEASAPRERTEAADLLLNSVQTSPSPSSPQAPGIH